MMSGYTDRRGSHSHPHSPRRYEVRACAEGWCITVDDCATRPFVDREAAMRIARQVQQQADALHHLHGNP